MGFILPIIFFSLLIAIVVVFFAFFPIEVAWFFHGKKISKRTQHARAPKQSQYAQVPSMKKYRLKDEDNFDDPEL